LASRLSEEDLGFAETWCLRWHQVGHLAACRPSRVPILPYPTRSVSGRRPAHLQPPISWCQRAAPGRARTCTCQRWGVCAAGERIARSLPGCTAPHLRASLGCRRMGSCRTTRRPTPPSTTGTTSPSGTARRTRTWATRRQVWRRGYDRVRVRAQPDLAQRLLCCCSWSELSGSRRRLSGPQLGRVPADTAARPGPVLMRMSGSALQRCCSNTCTGGWLVIGWFCEPGAQATCVQGVNAAPGPRLHSAIGYSSVHHVCLSCAACRGWGRQKGGGLGSAGRAVRAESAALSAAVPAAAPGGARPARGCLAVREAAANASHGAADGVRLQSAPRRPASPQPLQPLTRGGWADGRPRRAP